MRILVTNDDGVSAPGLWSVAKALADVGEVTVVAPDRDQSGIGTARTLLAVVRVHEVESQVDGIKTFAVEGTPADCVILATETLSAQPFDLIVSGINQGANLGLDVMDSGTVGATFQAYYRKIPAIAVSVASLTNVQYEAASHTVKCLAQAISKNSFPAPLLLNVNLPNVATDKIAGVAFTRLGPKAYLENVERGNDGRRTHYWIKHNKPTNIQAMEGTDIWAVRNNQISITPLDLIFSNGDVASELSALTDEISVALGLNGSG